MPLATAKTISPIAPICQQADPRHEGAASLLWWLVRSHAGHEVSVATELFDAGARVLLPLCEYDRRTPNGTRKRTRRAVFDGYLFLCGEDEFDRLNALSAMAGRNAWTIPVYDVPKLVRELGALLDAVDAGMVLGPARPIAAGRRCRVVDGPWMGMEGVYIGEGKRAGTFLLEMTFIGQATPVPFEPWQVEPIDPGEDIPR